MTTCVLTKRITLDIFRKPQQFSNVQENVMDSARCLLMEQMSLDMRDATKVFASVTVLLPKRMVTDTVVLSIKTAIEFSSSNARPV